MNAAGRTGMVCAAVAFALLAPHARAETAAQKWLQRDCLVDDGNVAKSKLIAEGTSAETALINAYQQGMSSNVADDATQAAEDEYDEVLAALDAGKTYGLSAAQIASIRSTSRAAFAQKARSNAVRAFSEAALTGLGALGLPNGIALLHQVAANPHSPDRETANAVLRLYNLPATSP